MKRKTLTLCLCLLAMLSLVGIGFAAWQITKPANSEPTNGSIEAYVAESVGASVSLSWKDLDNDAQTPDNQFIFGLPKNLPDVDNRNYKWFSYGTDADDVMKEEVLSLTLVITVTNPDELLDGSNLYVYLKPTDLATYNAIFDDEIAEKINGLGLNADTDNDQQNDSILLKTLSKTEVASGTYELVISTGFGSVFGNGNPYTVFGNEKYDEGNTNHTNVETNLNKLSGLNGLGFSLVVTNEEPAANA